MGLGKNPGFELPGEKTQQNTGEKQRVRVGLRVG